MSRNEKGRNMAHLDQTMDLGARVRWFIRGNYQGGGTIKRLCREFNWNEAKAKRVFNGEGIRGDDLDLMAKRWGWRFVDFIFGPMTGQSAGGRDDISQHVAELRASVERLHDCMARGALLVRGEPVSPRADAALGGRALPGAGAAVPGAGETVPAGSGAGGRVGVRDPGVKRAAE
jgi:hypothetical protein